MPPVEPPAFAHTDNFKDPESQKRECTDWFWIIVFVIFWGGMLAVGSLGYIRGNPSRMIWPEDSKGDTCGLNNTLYNVKGKDLTNFPVLYFGDPTNPPGIQTCLHECPKTGNIFSAAFTTNTALSFKAGSDTSAFSVPCTIPELIRSCYNQEVVANISRDNGVFCPLPPHPFYLTCIAKQGVTFGSTAYNAYSSGQCFCPYATSPKSRRCFPTKDALKTGGNLTGNSDAATAKIQAEQDKRQDSNPASLLFGDFVEVWWWVLIMVFVAIIFCFIYLLALKVFAGAMVYATIVFLVLIFCGATAGLIIAGNQQVAAASSSVGKQGGQGVVYIGYAFAACTFLLICFLIFMWKRIRLAVDIIKEASIAIQSMPELVFFPGWLISLFVIFLTYWLTALLWLASAKVYVDGTGWVYDSNTQYAIIYHFFGFFWNTNMLIAVTYVVVAGAVAQWYWTGCGEIGGVDKPEAIPVDAVWHSWKRTWNYHMGSIFLGSLILAAVQFARFCFEAMKKGLEVQLAKGCAGCPPQMKDFSLGCVKFMLCCCSCCFKCLEEFARFLTQNAYIMIAIKGNNFCKSGVSAFFLVGRNLFRVMAVDFIGDALLAMGKWMITIFVATVSYIFLFSYTTVPTPEQAATGDTAHTLNYPIFVWIVTIMLAYGISTLFMAVYELTIDTILLCFCEDCERNNGADRPYKMSARLKAFTDAHQDASDASKASREKAGKK